MSLQLAVAADPWPGEPAPFLKGTRQLIWVACFDVDQSRDLARRLVDAHFDVRALGERELCCEVRAPDLLVLDGDRASPDVWKSALRRQRLGTRVIVCFDARPALWFVGALTVLDDGPSQTRIVDAVRQHARWGADSQWERPDG